MSQSPDARVAGGALTRENENNQNRHGRQAPHPDAFGAGRVAPADRGGSRGRHQGTATAAPPLDLAQLTARDITVLRHLVRLRLLRYDQLHRLAFAGVDPSIVRRRIRHLVHAGWLTTWEAPARLGGHARYAHPTASAIRVVLPTLAPQTSWAPLVARMVPRSARRPLELGSTAPKWLPHQREVNHLVASVATAPARRMLWASSWDCPFPSRIGMFTLPQPDYVVVEELDGIPRLIFGEHDRGSEPIERFGARKIALYSALAAFPEFCAEQFGIASFRVHVTVIDPLRRAPIARLRALLDAARRAARPDIFRFTLAGWLHASPAAPIWFRVRRPPTADACAWSAHTGVTGAG